ncbi:PP0621 family protein [Massilia glaciei]|uniref:Deaminase n=1 Tax=Massilia glaciei TaxID=1524097 RepID=A0A2U2HHW7_9BURK|nr:PP0621 family protein [Massilia glaciei]PWF45503.1 hypothetical protein C7C56_017300 [Massilia glaciei]
MSTKLLFWIALIILVVLAVRKKLRAVARDGQPPAGARAGAGAPLVEAESMACCAHCGVYFPASEAVKADGLAYCSPAHVRLPPPK